LVFQGPTRKSMISSSFCLLVDELFLLFPRLTFLSNRSSKYCSHHNEVCSKELWCLSLIWGFPQYSRADHPIKMFFPLWADGPSTSHGTEQCRRNRNETTDWCWRQWWEKK
jgi:hypothetical protein